MALLTATLTISGAAQGDNLATVGSANGAALGDKGIREMIIVAPANAITYGTRIGASFTSTPTTVAANGTVTIGPFSGSAPTRTKEWFFKGTTNDVVKIFLVTQ